MSCRLANPLHNISNIVYDKCYDKCYDKLIQ